MTLYTRPTLVAFSTVVLACCAVVWAISQSAGNGSNRADTAAVISRVAVADAASMGSASAKVALIVFSDFQCRFCSEFINTVLPALKAEYVDPGQLRVVLKHFPNPVGRNTPVLAAEATECASLDGRSWDMAAVLFRSPGDGDPGRFQRAAAQAGVSRSAEFTACMDSGRMRAKVADQTAMAFDLGILSTPTFLLGYMVEGTEVDVVQRLIGADAFGELGPAIQALVAGGSSYVSRGAPTEVTNGR